MIRILMKLVLASWLNIGIVMDLGSLVQLNRHKVTWPISSHLDLTLCQLHCRVTMCTVIGLSQAQFRVYLCQ